MPITASHLYSFISCPHRIKRDDFDGASLKKTPNEFVQMLWEKGIKHEREVITKQKAAAEILDLSGLSERP